MSGRLIGGLIDGLADAVGGGLIVDGTAGAADTTEGVGRAATTSGADVEVQAAVTALSNEITADTAHRGDERPEPAAIGRFALWRTMRSVTARTLATGRPTRTAARTRQLTQDWLKIVKSRRHTTDGEL